MLAGSVNESQTLKIETTAVGNDTYLSALQNMTEHAADNKSAVGQLADSIAHWFVFSVLIIVAIVYIIWSYLDSSQALWIALSVLVVSCPCALSLATPTALTAASNQLAKLGVLILKPHTLQTLAEINTVAFDKTGTLTEGNLSLEEIEGFENLSQDTLINIACALEQHQKHPVAKALLNLPHKKIPMHDLKFHPGQGVSGKDNSHNYKIGKYEFCLSKLAEPSYSATHSVEIFLSIDEKLYSRFQFSDRIKPSSFLLVDTLNKNNLNTLVLSGDNQIKTELLAQKLHIKSAQGDLLPEKKAEIIQREQSKNNKVLMIGDGINDSLVLAKADVGIAVNTAADITQVNSDAVLTNYDLMVVWKSLLLAKKTRTIIKQNLLWALTYNICAIPLAAIGWVPPWLAAIGMTVSSLLVVMNALRLNTGKLNE